MPVSPWKSSKSFCEIEDEGENTVQKVRPIRNIRVFIKSMMRNPNICIRQITRRFHSFRDLVIKLSAEHPPISVLQIGANDGVNGDPLGDLILNETEKIKALLIEPQNAAYGRLSQRYASSPHVVCLNAAIDKKTGNRTMYSIDPQIVVQKTGLMLDDSIGSFDHHFVLRFLKRKMRRFNITLYDHEIEALITEETVLGIPLKQALEKSGTLQPEVVLVDVEGFDAEIVRMVLDDGLRPQLIQYEHSNLPYGERRRLSARLIQEGYWLWADRSDVWGQKVGH